MSRIICTMSLLMLIIFSAEAKIIKIPADYPKIQAGIDAAAQNDTVLVADGTYYENINFKGKAITVASYFLVDGDTTHINKAIINGSKPSHADSGSVVFFVSGEDTTSVLCGCTITGGTGTLATPPEGSARVGGGIFCYNSGARIINNKIIENAVHSPDKDVYGGGLAALPISSTAYVILQDNQISHNTLTADLKEVAGGGVELMGNGILVNNLISYNSIVHNATNYQAFSGGVDCWSKVSDRRKVFVESNKITHNSVVSKSNVLEPSATGGGISFFGSFGRCAKNEISYNELWANSNKGAGGAGIFINQAPSLIIAGNIIHNNAVKRGYGYGGGVLIGNYSSPMVINNIIDGNSATVGGGLIIALSTAHLINNTVINNQATNGGGINVRMTSTVYLMNTIVWGNQAPTYAGIQLESGNTAQAACCDIQGGWTGNINSDPLFVPGAAQLSDMSPCLGTGMTSFNFGNVTLYAPDTDILGNSRPSPSNSRPDIGAFEHDRAFPKQFHLVEVPGDYSTIQAGINAAFPGDTVLVADGTYYENIDFKGKAITVASHFLIDGDTTHVNSTIIDGSKPTHPDSGSVVFFVSGEDTTSVLQGFTITGGTGTETIGYEATKCRAGGGLLCYKAGARILNNKITGNAGSSPDKSVVGGGLAALPTGSTAYLILKSNQIMHNTLTANSGHTFGGGMALWINGMLVDNLISYNAVVQNSTDKQAGSGGVDIECRNLIMASNKIAHNSVTTYSDQEANTAFGGGCMIAGVDGRFAKNEVSHNEIWIKTGKNAVGGGIEIIQVADSFIIEGNIIRENSVKNGKGWGGGIGFYDCSPYVVNNIISGNSVTTGGGGLYIALNVKVRLINNTIINNHASEYGGGVIVTNSFAAPVLLNSIIWNNQAPTGAAIRINSGTVQTAYCDIQGNIWPGTGNINLDPRLDADSLLYGSPCIDTGIESYDFGTGGIRNCPATDINGRSRPLGVRPDIGAWESLPPPDDVAEMSNRIPDDFALQQNYPNPFNPSTIIQYALPKPGQVRLVIYDLLGRSIKILMDAQQPAGQFQVIWDATNEQNQAVAAGVYFCHLRVSGPSTGSGDGAGQEFVRVIKLVLIK